MSSMTIGIYELELDVEFDIFPEEGDGWETEYFAGDIDVTSVNVHNTDISLMMLLTDDQITEIEDEVVRCWKEDEKDNYVVPDEY
mgnify:CR=1 FL=1